MEPRQLDTLLSQLEQLSQYEGKWQPLRSLAPRLQAKIKEMQQRIQKWREPLIIAVVGGSGVGKSTLVNAIAGDIIAEMSKYRPCTKKPMLYHPPEWSPDERFTGCDSVPRSSLENIVIIDTPDTDTVIKEHRKLVEIILRHCDLVLCCGSAEKYIDEATLSLLREIRGERSFILVETRLEMLQNSILEDWKNKLTKEGIYPIASFRVNALHALNRKLSSQNAGEEFEYPKLEQYLEEHITQEFARKLKEKNILGMMKNLTQELHEITASVEGSVQPIKELINRKKVEISAKAEKITELKISENGLLFYRWLKYFVSQRIYGIFSLMSSFAQLIHRLPMVLRPWRILTSSKNNESVYQEELEHLVSHITTEINHQIYKDLLSLKTDISLYLDKLQIDHNLLSLDMDNLKLQFFNTMQTYLLEKSLDELDRKSNILTSFLCVQLFYLPTYAMVGLIAYTLIPGYFKNEFVGINFLIHSGYLLALVIFISYWLYDKFILLLAQSIKKRLSTNLKEELINIINPFQLIEKELDELNNITKQIKNVIERV